MSGKKSSTAKAVNPGPNNSETANQSAPERCTTSIQGAAHALGISRASAYNYAKDGTLPVIRLGKRLLVPLAALEKMLQA
jgi:excisionase family DNA binding protein